METTHKKKPWITALIVLGALAVLAAAVALAVVFATKKSSSGTVCGGQGKNKKTCAPGTFCDTTTNTCLQGCASDVDCTLSKSMPQRCDTSTNLCFGLPCRDATDCSGDQTCSERPSAATLLCTGAPLPADSADTTHASESLRTIYTPPTGLSVANMIKWLIATGVPANKVVLGFSSIGASLAPVTSDALSGLAQPYAVHYPNAGLGPSFAYRDVMYAQTPGDPRGRLAFIGNALTSFIHTTTTRVGAAATVVDRGTYAYVPHTSPYAASWLATYANGAAGGLFFSYETQNSVTQKTQFALENNLAGVMLHGLEGDTDTTPQTPRGLLDTIRLTIQNTPVASSFIVAGYFGDEQYTRGKECAVIAPTDTDLSSFSPPASCVEGTKRNVGELAAKCTHVHFGTFTISYRKPTTTATLGSFYVDTTHALRDFAWTVGNVASQGRFPPDLGTSSSCISPSAGTAAGDCTPEGAQASHTDTAWSCWNDQRVRPRVDAGPRSDAPATAAPAAVPRTCRSGSGAGAGTGRGTPPPPAFGPVYGGIASKRWLQDRGVKVLASIGGWNDSDYFSPACSPAFVADFVASIVAWVTVFKFDGVDLNWQFPGMEKQDGVMLPNTLTGYNSFKDGAPDNTVSTRNGTVALTTMNCAVSRTCNYKNRSLDAENLLAFVTALRAALDARYLISLSISAEPVFIQSLHYEKLAPFVTYFNVMCYDFNNSKLGLPSKPVTALASPLYPPPCTSNADCLSGAATESCNVASGVCVQCTSNTDCLRSTGVVAGHQCDLANNTCYCSSTAECAPGLACIDQTCRGCNTDNECAPGTKCDTAAHQCVRCTSDADCTNPVSNSCDRGACVPYGYAINSPAFNLRYPLNAAAANQYFTADKYKDARDVNVEKCCAGDPSVMKDGKLNGALCRHDAAAGRVEMPWSTTCDDSAAVIGYCSSVNPVTGRLALMEDANCRSWCLNRGAAANPDGGCSAPSPKCSQMMIEFCKNHPESRDCRCLNYATGDTYKKFEAQIRTLLPGDDPATQNPVCWDPDCAGTNMLDVLRIDDMEKTWCACEGHNVNICEQIINTQDSNVVISNLDWNQVCPGPSPVAATCRTDDRGGGANNRNVCLYGSWTCGNPYRYPCTDNAQCGVAQGECITSCAGGSAGQCTNNNTCGADKACSCVGNTPCSGDEFCDTSTGRCQKQCVGANACRPGERCVAGTCSCAGGPACPSSTVCNTSTGACEIPCGTCSNGNTCNPLNGKCECTAGQTCTGKSVCEKIGGGTAHCT
jgi:GH18 family chitinase